MSSASWLTPAVQRLIDLALEEDLGRGDVTTDAVIGPELRASGRIVSREALVVAGTEVAAEIFRRLDPGSRVKVLAGDGAEAAAARDALIKEKLEPLLERAARGELASWAASPKRRLALILLFDQVPRNCYRGTAAAFAFDREALALSVEGLQLAADAAWPD